MVKLLAKGGIDSVIFSWGGGLGGGGELQKSDSGEMPESVFRVSEKTLTKLISEF